MDFKDTIIAATQSAVDDLFRYARATSADKQTWKPLDEGRSVIDIVAECALSPLWGADLLKTREFKMEPDFMEKFIAEKSALSTVEAAEAKCRENCETLYASIREFPDADMGTTIFLPFGDDHNWTIPKVMSLQQWNCPYHLGQVAYVQTLFGDRDMH